ncbi:MAG TPA: exosortase-associated EpsI family protein [Phycisphaerae bacterium]|nr:exosortase-associated EpsI family protein [Phycisphaerae bacterium]HRY69473.1 exosortase-associated EpsI family protein [Phycisphaerae bacterium]HSA29113.1 exosortase-associated EpsI family protein [Phycisphaerae bacterium]
MTTPAGSAAKPVHPPNRSLTSAFRNGWFVACLGLLLTFAATFQLMAYAFAWQTRKLPVPLRKPLDGLDQTKLFGYKFHHNYMIKPEVLEKLGTKEYIQWVFQDVSPTASKGPEDFISLFVTYYTGQPDQVPHVPEECYSGGGYEIQREDILEIPVTHQGKMTKVPFKILTMDARSDLREKRTVIYTFHANGQFCADRNAVRTVVADPAEKYAYFSKLELTFGVNDALPTREAAIESGRRFIQQVVPLLLDEHWPDWQQVKQAQQAASAKTPANN